MDFYKYKLLKVSSDDKRLSSETNASFSVDISKISHKSTEKAIGCALIEASFENFFYNVRTGINDVFSFQEASQSRTNITFTEGYYSATNLITKLTTDINMALTIGSVVVSQNSISKKLQFVFAGVTAQIIVDNTSNLSDMLGFTLTTGYGNTLTGNSIPRFFGLTHAYLECKELAPSHLFDAKNSNPRDVLSVIPMTAGFGSVNYFSNPVQNDRVTWTTPRPLTLLTFKLTNADGDVLNLQNGKLKIVLAILY